MPTSLFRVPTLRRRRRAGASNDAAVVERLETRLLLTAGDSLWAPPVDFVSGEEFFSDVAVQADGKIVAVGRASVSTGGPAHLDFLVARYTADGRLDKSFGFGDGWHTYDFNGGQNDYAYAVVVQPDGRIVVGGGSYASGSFNEDFALLRLDRNGEADGTFGSGGRVLTQTSGSEVIRSLALASNSRIVAAGYASAANDGVLIRYTSSGGFDASFDFDGRVDLTASSGLSAVAVDAADRVVVVDIAGDVRRLTAAGASDTSFSLDGEDGVATIRFQQNVGIGFVVNSLSAVAIDASGRIVVGGGSYYVNPGDPFNGIPSSSFGFQAGVARLLADGSVDGSFGDDGQYSFANDGAIEVRDLAPLPNGGLVGAGSSEGGLMLATFSAAGTLDPGFGGDGVRVYAGLGGAAGLAKTLDGHFVVAGADFSVDPGRPVIAAFQGRFPRRDDLLGWTTSGEWYVAASTGAAFQTAGFGAWSPAYGAKFVGSGDFNGDGKADVVGRDASGFWRVGLNTSAAFATTVWRTWNEAASWRDERLADFNGDGKTDVAARASNGYWWVMLSTGAAFGAPAVWTTWNEAAGWRDVLAADFTGDGRADIAARAANGEWWVARNRGADFATSRWAAWNASAGWRDVRAGDFNGDGMTDIAGRTSNGEWYVAETSFIVFGSVIWRFDTTRRAAWNEAAAWRDVVVGDFDGDGRTDIAGRASNGYWYVARSTGAAFTTSLWDTWNETAGWRDVRVGDFDGDGKEDIAGRTSNGQWWVSKSGGTRFTKSLWGTWTESAGWKTIRDEFKLLLT